MQKNPLMAVLLITLCFISFKNSSIQLGDTLPMADQKIVDVSGNTVSLKSAVGSNGLLVMFSCNTCPFVIKNQQRTIAICNYAQENNVGVVLLNSNEAGRNGGESFEKMQQYAKGQSYNWIYALDKNNAIADAFDANRTPECFLFDKNLSLVYHGAIDDSPQEQEKVTREHLKIAIEETVSGMEVTSKETRSVGCAIKRKG